MSMNYDVKNMAAEYLIKHYELTNIEDDNHHYLEMIAQAGGESAVRYLIRLHSTIPVNESTIAQRFMLLKFISSAANNS